MVEIDLFAPLEPKGSAQCPVCGKFRRIVHVGHDMYWEDVWAVVDCPDHGRQEA